MCRHVRGAAQTADIFTSAADARLGLVDVGEVCRRQAPVNERQATSFLLHL